MTDKRFRLSDDAFATFENLKAKETTLETAKKICQDRHAREIREIEASARETRNITSSFLNGWAASAGVPPGHLFIEEYGEFRANRKRTAEKKKTRSRKRRKAE